MSNRDIEQLFNQVTYLYKQSLLLAKDVSELKVDVKKIEENLNMIIKEKK